MMLITILCREKYPRIRVLPYSLNSCISEEDRCQYHLEPKRYLHMTAHYPYIWENGSVMEWEKGTTHAMNPSLHYGIAAFEGIRFYDTEICPAIFRLHDHLMRFFYSMNALGMSHAYSYAQLGSAIIDLIKRNNTTEGYIRPIAWFSDEKIGLHNAGGAVSVQIALFEWEKSDKDSMSIELSPFQRIHPKTTDIEAKISGHYINTHLALKHATSNGFDDAVLTDDKGYIAEASAANLFCRRGNALYTPRRGAILNGITRQTVIELARNGAHRVEEINLLPHMLGTSAEIFLCGTAYEIMPVGRINDMIIGTQLPGPFTRWIQEQYRKAVHGELPEHKDWLTYVNRP